MSGEKYPVLKLDVESETWSECQQCWRSWEGPHALGVGARHAAANPGHEVHAHTSKSVTFLGARSPR